jgi:hypothetical protein
MKADNIDYFEVVLPYMQHEKFLDLLGWMDRNYIDCQRTVSNVWIVTGCDDATLMKLRWG